MIFDLIRLTSVIILLSFNFAIGIQDDGNSTLESAIRKQEEGGFKAKTILSRSKRFLTFPDGSSLQLVQCSRHDRREALTWHQVHPVLWADITDVVVFCCQTANIIFEGDIFLYGNTVALAWELPSDPSFLYKFKDKHGNFLRRKDGKGDNVRNIYYTDERGKLLFKVPYRRRFIVNPAFAKRSVRDPFQIRNKKLQEETSKLGKQPPTEADRKEMHALQQKREYLKSEHMSESTVEFHRHSRKGLYEKLEVFLRALGMDGRQCLLRTLCETGTRSTDDEQGSFMGEMMRAVFTLPQGVQFEKEKHQKYDTAHRATQSCDTLYPGCKATLPENLYI